MSLHTCGERLVKRLNIRSFQPTLWLSSAVDVESMSTPDESHNID